MAESEILDPAVVILRQQVLHAPCLRRIRLCVEVDELAAQPTVVAVASAEPIDLLDVVGARHALILAT